MVILISLPYHWSVHAIPLNEAKFLLVIPVRTWPMTQMHTWEVPAMIITCWISSAAYNTERREKQTHTCLNTKKPTCTLSLYAHTHTQPLFNQQPHSNTKETTKQRNGTKIKKISQNIQLLFTGQIYCILLLLILSVIWSEYTTICTY